VFDHVDLPVSNVAASADFYRIVLAPLGMEETALDPPEFGALSFVERSGPEPLHIALIAESQAAVRAFHRAGVDAGYRSNGAPGLRRYAADYYAAYLLDPDGHNVEAVHRSKETRSRWKWLARGLVPLAET
jgi:catechol 2,3-dioxygenase-like lactoylglutathione lyase family enzyme